MSYFQNPFANDFQGSFVLGDRHHQPTFRCPRNAGRGDDLVISWADGPFDLSGNDGDGNTSDTLEIFYSIHPPFDRWALLSVDVTVSAASTAAVNHLEIVSSLSSNNSFTAWFEASNQLPILVSNSDEARTHIRARRSIEFFRFYVVNGRAEAALQFNARAGVAELPTYYDRHKVTHLFTSLAALESFPDRMNQLITLFPEDSGDFSGGVESNVDDDIITNAVDAFGKSLGLDSSTIQEDWELLKGQSGLFEFTSGPSEGAIASTETEIVYPAGAKVGDLATRTVTELDSGSAIVNKFVLPHILIAADIILPP